MKQEARHLAGGELIAGDSDALPLEQREQFWQQLVDFESAPSAELFGQLAAAGVDLPDPDSIDDAKVTSTLWHLVAALAQRRVFIDQTDHLSDRELYSVLWRETLREEYPVPPDLLGGAWHVDILGGWSDADTVLYLKHYADDASRRYWLVDFPDYDMPAHEDPPYDRDRSLPKPYGENPPRP